MRLTSFTDFGLRALMRLAGEPARVFTTDEIAQEFGISRHHLTKVIRELAAAGFVATQRGVGGGFRLARPAEEVTLEPIVGRAAAVLLEHAGLADRLSIVEGTLDDDVAKPFQKGAVRIALAVGERVVLAVAGDPLLGDDCGGQPEPDPHRKRRQHMEFDPTVRLRTMQEERDTHVGDVPRDDDK